MNGFVPQPLVYSEPVNDYDEESNPNPSLSDISLDITEGTNKPNCVKITLKTTSLKDIVDYVQKQENEKYEIPEEEKK